MTPRPSRRRSTVAGALVLVGALLLVGCQGDSSGSARGDSTGSSSPSKSPTVASPTPSVAPATGPSLQSNRTTINAPTGWKPMDAVVKFEKAARDPRSASVVSAVEMPSAPRSLESEMRAARSTGGYVGRVRTLPTLTADGQEMFHLSGRTDPYTVVDIVGAVHNDTALAVTFSFDRGWTPARRQAVIDSVIASIDWY